ncbi:MAG TPA: hypothetical protein VIY27_00400 [Myxococcota bacterium]
MSSRHTRLASYLLLATLAAACAGEATEEGATPLPAAIHGLALVESHSGNEAAQILIEMHGAEVVPPENHIGYYGTEELEAALYISRFDGAAAADSSRVAMEQRIGAGSSGYGHPGRFEAGDHPVHMVFGYGQVHFFYTDAEALVWLAADMRIARPALAELLQTVPDSIPTFEEIMRGREAADAGSG